MPEHICVCTQPDAVGGGMHIVGLQSVNPNKEEEKANAKDEAVATVEYIFKCIKIN